MSIALTVLQVGLSLFAGSLITLSPCVFPLLTLVASEGGVARGGLVLGIFGLGAAIPLVVVAYASRCGFMRMRGWVLSRMEKVRYGFALLPGAMGVAILTGGDQWLEAKALEWLPDAWVNFTVGI